MYKTDLEIGIMCSQEELGNDMKLKWLHCRSDAVRYEVDGAKSVSAEHDSVRRHLTSVRYVYVLKSS